MKPNLPALKTAVHKVNRFLFGKDISVNGVTVGRGAGNFATNTVIGSGALASNTVVINNVAIGFEALRFINAQSEKHLEQCNLVLAV